MTDTATKGVMARLSEIKKLGKKNGPEAAEAELIALIKEVPDAHQAYGALARVLLKQGKTDYAARAAEKASALAPLDARYHTLVGVARMRQDDIDGAAAAFAQALEIDKTFAQAILGAAAVKMASENYDDALALCERALDLDPSMQRAHELVARINMKQGNPGAAAQELRRLLEQEGGSDRALRAYMRLMRKEGRLDDVVELAEVNLSTAPATPKSVARYARMVSFAGQPELAVEQYRALIEGGKAREVDRVRFVSALIAAGALDEARETIETLKDRRAMRPLKEKLTGDVELAAGNPDAAIALYAGACKSARTDGLDPGENTAADPTALAKAWQSHTAKVLREALRAHRSEKAAKRA